MTPDQRDRIIELADAAIAEEYANNANPRSKSFQAYGALVDYVNALADHIEDGLDMVDSGETVLADASRKSALRSIDFWLGRAEELRAKRRKRLSLRAKVYGLVFFDRHMDLAEECANAPR